MTPLERLMAKVERTDTCWLWRGAIGKAEGYGMFWLSGRMIAAHRAAYMLLVRPISDGLELDHLCRHRACVNPLHLEAVTHRENLMRGVGAPALHAQKTHCANGHPLTEDNLRRADLAKGRRTCRTCAKRRSDAYRARLAVAQ